MPRLDRLRHSGVPIETWFRWKTSVNFATFCKLQDDRPVSLQNVAYSPWLIKITEAHLGEEHAEHTNRADTTR